MKTKKDEYGRRALPLTETKHTPLRWTTIQNGKIHLEYDKGGIYDGTVAINVISEDEAERIVRAVNSHKALLSLAQNFLSACDIRLSLLEDNEDKGSEDVAEQIEHWKAYRKSISKTIKQATGGK